VNNGKICVSICAETVEDLVSRLRRAEEVADIVEIRFDCLRPDQLKAALGVTSTRLVIATFRSPDQGGANDTSFLERLAFWKEAGSRFWAVDLERDIFAEINTSGTRILSFHDHSGLSNHLDAEVAKMRSIAPDILKVAVHANDAVDAIAAWNLLKNDAPIIPIAMGEAGKWTRILGLAHGAYLTYASLDAGSETADGQIVMKDLVETYRVKELTDETSVYGVIGDPVSASMSPFIQNPAFQEANVDSIFVHLQVKDLNAFIRRMVDPDTREVNINLAGFSVTMPHKQAILRHLDDIDPVAEKIGAVNTVKITGDKLKGFNTDAGGFIKPLKERFGDLSGARAVVAGAGGAARAVVYALSEAKADVTILARDASKAAALAQDFGAEYGDLVGSSLGEVDILVNATPLGMRGPDLDKKLFAADQLSGVKFICDLVTSVTDTPLLREAKNARIPAIGGIEMLIAQAEMQFEIWTGSLPKTGLMRESLLERMRS
jgi:3-dehydroquinate dehydratase/shikimate dehydrogenase